MEKETEELFSAGCIIDLTAPCFLQHVDKCSAVPAACAATASASSGSIRTSHVARMMEVRVIKAATGPLTLSETISLLPDLNNKPRAIQPETSNFLQDLFKTNLFIKHFSQSETRN